MKRKEFLAASAATMVAVLFTARAQSADRASLEAAFAKVRAVADGICTVTSVQLLSKADPEGKDPLAMWRAEAKDSVTVTSAFVRIDFTLVPEKGSDIRCRAELPLPERWDGRLWGQGNSGRAGSLPSLSHYIAVDTAAVTTDLGTKASGPKFLAKSIPWPAGVLRDFHWRATHLMTVYGKRFVKAFYGRPCDHAYFCGGSTGGRQGMSEAIRYPEDYDGIISILPDNNAAVSEIAIWHLGRQTHDADGKLLFTSEEIKVVADAAVEYRARTDPAPYAGFVVADGRFTEADIDGFLALAAKKCPSLAAGDKLARLKALYRPVMHNGKCYFNGFAPGTNHGANMKWKSLLSLPHFLAGKGFVQSRWNEVGWDEVDLYLKEFSPEVNACSADLSAFRARGGKIIMTAGWEDQTIPPAPIVDYYERVCEKEGGIENTSRYFRLFCLPGCAHGGGKGRGTTGSPCGAKGRNYLVDWCERGKAPEVFSMWWESKKLSVPVPPYPGLAVQEAGGKWSVKMTPRGGVARISGNCLETNGGK